MQRSVCTQEVGFARKQESVVMSSGNVAIAFAQIARGTFNPSTYQPIPVYEVPDFLQQTHVTNFRYVSPYGAELFVLKYFLCKQNKDSLLIRVVPLKENEYITNLGGQAPLFFVPPPHNHQFMNDMRELEKVDSEGNLIIRSALLEHGMLGKKREEKRWAGITNILQQSQDLLESPPSQNSRQSEDFSLSLPPPQRQVPTVQHMHSQESEHTQADQDPATPMDHNISSTTHTSTTPQLFSSNSSASKNRVTVLSQPTVYLEDYYTQPTQETQPLPCTLTPPPIAKHDSPALTFEEPFLTQLPTSCSPPPSPVNRDVMSESTSRVGIKKEPESPPSRPHNSSNLSVQQRTQPPRTCRLNFSHSGPRIVMSETAEKLHDTTTEERLDAASRRRVRPSEFLSEQQSTNSSTNSSRPSPRPPSQVESWGSADFLDDSAVVARGHLQRGRGEHIRRKRPWTEEEEQALRDGVRRYGVGCWADIKKSSIGVRLLKERDNIALKDKWRNMNKRPRY